MNEQTHITSIDDLMAKVKGGVVVGGHEDETGLHLELEDGRYLIFTGNFVVGLYRVCSPTIN